LDQAIQAQPPEERAARHRQDQGRPDQGRFRVLVVGRRLLIGQRLRELHRRRYALDALRVNTHEKGVYPAWICHGCGVEHGRVIEGHMASYHEPDGSYGCGWCGRKDVPLTEPRDYGYPALYK
jgi:hypothetical protein